MKLQVKTTIYHSNQPQYLIDISYPKNFYKRDTIENGKEISESDIIDFSLLSS